MKRCIAAFAIIFIIIAGSINALAANGVSAKSAILIEKDSGRVMFEIGGVEESVAREAMRLAMHKLPLKCKFVRKADQETEGDSQ